MTFAWDPFKFLSALLLDRFVPLSLSAEALQKRADAVERLSATFAIPEENQASLGPRWDPLLAKLTLGIGRLGSGKTEEAALLYQEASDLLAQGVELEKGDKKKWPEVTPEDRSIRLLTNYFASEPDRYAVEESFRRFHSVRHLMAAREKIKSNLLYEGEKEIVIAQEELRHQAALALKLDLAFLREEAETLSQTQNREERAVTVEWVEKHLASQTPRAETLAKPLFAVPYPWEEILNPLRSVEFSPKEISVSSTEEWVKALQAQPKNLDARLSLNASWNAREGLRALLRLPDPARQQYWRMPDVERFQNSRLFDSQGRLLLHFDEAARLAYGPSVREMEMGSDPDDGEILDAAVIGGGPGGIAAGVAFTCLGVFRVAIFERSEANSTVKDIWSREKEADTWYSGRPDPIEGLVGMQDTTRAVYLNRMNTFIDYFHLNLRSREPILNLTREKSKLWTLETPKGKYRARNVLWTSGRYGKPKLLKWEEEGIPDELKSHILRGVEVDEIRNSTVVVIGGGNTAFDNVRTLTSHGTGEKGNRVYVAYPRKPFNVPGSMHAHNNDQLLQWEERGKVQILWNANTVAVEAQEEGGRRRWKIFYDEKVEGKDAPERKFLIVDYIAPAVGWMIDKGTMEGLGVHFVEGKNPDCDPATLQAYGRDAQENRLPIPGLFIAGDYFLQRSVPAAFTTNYRAAVAIAERLKKP